LKPNIEEYLEVKHTEIGTLIATASGLKLFDRIPIDWLTGKQTMKGIKEWMMQIMNG